MVWIIVLVLAAIIWFTVRDYNKNDGSWFTIASSIFCIVSFSLLFFSIINMMVSTDWKISDKIAMYEEENVKIEEQLAAVVSNYMEYEKGIIFECAPGEAMTLVTLYPDLASRQLVSVQMDVYIENSKKLKELKSEYYETEMSRWWLYFG